jgi:hypothetical protein
MPNVSRQYTDCGSWQLKPKPTVQLWVKNTLIFRYKLFFNKVLLFLFKIIIKKEFFLPLIQEASAICLCHRRCEWGEVKRNFISNGVQINRNHSKKYHSFYKTYQAFISIDFLKIFRLLTLRTSELNQSLYILIGAVLCNQSEKIFLCTHHPIAFDTLVCVIDD